MKQDVIIFVPFENKKQAKEAGKDLLERGLAFVVRVSENIEQAWREENGKIGEASVSVLRIRASEDKVNDIYQQIKKIHPWPVFCFEVFRLDKLSK